VSQISKFCLLLALSMAVSSLAAARLSAQDADDDPNQPPLGDVARNLRKNNPPPQQVIDNDNLPDVVRQAENRHTSVLRFLMAGSEKDFQVSAPDVTCSLSFTASTKALLSDQYAQMDLPPSEMFKLNGPATIEGDAFTVSLFNGTDWHVSEIDVAFTLVKKNVPAAADAAPSAEGFSPLSPPASPQAPQYDLETDAVRPEKKADHTVIFKMRAAAPPLGATTFSAPLGVDLSSAQEWHWAIIQAKGYPPQNRMAATDKTSSADAHVLDSGPTQSPPQNLPTIPSPVALTQPQ
jgi:hypothetical protein